VTKPFDEGMKVERESFVHLVQTPESKALRHAFFGERAASKIGDVPEDTPTRKIAKVGVIGAGTMGGGITMNFLNAGIPVTILETKQEALDKGVGIIRKNYENSIKKGKLTQEKLDQRMGLLKPTLSYDDLKDADLIIEAVFEEIGVKEQVFKKLDEVAKPGAILASNTSTLDVNKIANFTKRPQDVVGMHFFSPANVMKLLEVVRGAATAKDVLATVMQIAKKIRKTAVVSGVCDGFIGNRMIEHYGRVAGFLVEEGATPWQVDKALEKWGMAMGPFRMGDLAGNDIGWAIRKRRYVEKPDVKYAKIADKLCEQGRFGQKTGMGWYRYEAGKRDAIPDPEVDKLIAGLPQGTGHHAAQDFRRRDRRALHLRPGERGRAHRRGRHRPRASDIDMMYLTGYGFPLHPRRPDALRRPGRPLQRRAAHAGFAAESGDAFWEPAPLLAKLAAEGKTFNPHRIPENKMTDAVIVSTARTGLAKSWRGSLQHDPRRHARRPCRQARRGPRRHRPGRGRGRHHGLRHARRRHRQQHRAPDRAARRPAGDRAGRHRQSLLLLGPADHRHGRAAHDRRRRCR
jgi:3-hydroxyacyl-CoA dehydrogenase